MGIAEQYEMLRKVGIEHSAEQLLLMTQYFDTMQDVARNGRSNVLYLPSNPGTVGSMGDEIRNAMLQAQAAGESEATGKAAQDAFDRDEAQRERREEEQRRADQARHHAEQKAKEAQNRAQNRPPNPTPSGNPGGNVPRSEEHTSELQSRGHLVCRLLLEKKKDTAE